MANKPASQKPTDLAMDVLRDEFNRGLQANQAEVEAMKTKLEVAPWLHRMAGKIEATGFFRAQSEFFRLVMLKQVKDCKEYREKYGMSWEQFCESVGVSRRWIDEQLSDLKPFRVTFLEEFLRFSGVDFNKIKYLGDAVTGGTAGIKGNSIIFDGETIPVTPEHAEEIQAVLERIEEALGKEQEEHQAEKKTLERRMADEKKHIQQLEKEIAKFEKSAKAKGLSPEEDAFLQQMDNLKTGFDGFYMLNVDPARIQIDAKTASKRIRAAYISTLQYMKMQILSAYDTAVDNFADPSMMPEEGWKPGKK